MSGTCAGTLNICVPAWQCEPGQTGYEADGCGNRRPNPACLNLPVGSASFSSIPAGAEIFIDGADQGVKTPFTVTRIPAGPHMFTLKLAGYNDKSGSITVVAGSTVQASANLTATSGPAGKGGMIVLALLGLGVLGAVVYASRDKRG